MDDDRLRQHVLEELHAGPAGYRGLVRDVARARPEMEAGALVGALSSVAAEMDAAIRRAGASTVEARMARRLAALLAMDAADQGTPAAVTLGALHDHWAANDDFFLRL